MEEKILEKLDSLDKKMDRKIDALDKKIDEKVDALDKKIDEKVDALDKKIDEKIEAMDKKFNQKFDAMEKRLDKKFDQKFDKMKKELRSELTADLEREILDRMFVFEEDYGKRLTIAYEDLICRHAAQEKNSEQIAILERRETLNTAYVQSHEARIQELEKIKI